MTGDILMQNIMNGLALGCTYALIAIGYTMVYGIIRLINFAHSNIFCMSLYFSYIMLTLLGIYWLPGYIIAIICTALLGVSTDAIAYKPLRNAPRISAFVSAVAVSYILENLMVIIFGGRPKAYPIPDFLQGSFYVGSVNISYVNVAILVVTVVCLAALSVLLYRTRSGRAMRAMFVDFETARLMGVNVNKTIRLTFILGSSLAAVAGFMYGSKYPQITPYVASIPGMKAFIAAVFGGIGNVHGATIGGILIGLIEVMFVAFFPSLSGYRDAISFVILIVILLYMPNGLLGSRDKVKV